MNLRRLVVTVTVSALAVMPLAACDTSTPPSDPTTSASIDTHTPAPTTTALTNQQKDRIFLRVIAEYGLSGQEAIDAAKAMCDALDRGNSAEQVALIALDGLDGDIDKAGALLGAGSATYCPEYADALANVGGSAA